MLAFTFLPFFSFLFYKKMNLKWISSTWALFLCFFSFSFYFYSPLGMTKIYFSFFLDSVSLLLIMLTCWISSLMVLSSKKILFNNNSPMKFIFSVLSLNAVIILMFMQKSLILMYLYFEFSLIPTFLLILIWGYQPERMQASMYLIIYTVTAALPFLMNILFIYNINAHMNMLLPMKYPLISSLYMINFWWMILLTVFMVKLPIYSMHLWLPKAHVEAPVAGSMILAGLLLKLGGYGIFRLNSIFFMKIMQMNFFFMSMALVGGVISSFICIRQNDMKSLIAYSSIGHMGVMLAGLLTMTAWGMKMAFLMMIAHGLSSSCLFSMSNMMYEMSNSRSLMISKGFIAMWPTFSMWFFLLSAVNMAAPPSINLLSEIGLIMSIIFLSKMTILLIMFLTFLSAVYSLFLYVLTQHGKLSSFVNSFLPLKKINYTIIFLHWFPTQIMILFTEFFY